MTFLLHRSGLVLRGTIAVVGLLAVLLVPAARLATAQNQVPITIRVRAGFEGAYRVGEWFPVTIDIANDWRDVRGSLEWRFSRQGDEPTFSQPIDLPRGARKRITMMVVAYGRSWTADVVLVEDGRDVVSQNLTLDPYEVDRFAVGVISSDPALLNILNSIQITATSTIFIRHIALDTLPEHVAALGGLDAIVLDDPDTSRLSPAQRDALRQWVQTGGQIVVGGGVNAPQVAGGLADLLPASVSSDVTPASLRPLSGLEPTLAGNGIAETTTVSVLQPQPGATVYPRDGPPLLVSRDLGNGRVIMSAFNLTALRGWSHEETFWANRFRQEGELGLARRSRTEALNLIQSGLKLPSLGLPSGFTVLGFLLLYIIALGPANYLILRRMRRMELAWISLPLTVLVFAIGLYMVGFGLRSGQILVNQIAVVETTEGQPRGVATAFMGVFSPRRGSYTLDLPGNTLITENGTWGRRPDPLTLISTGDTTQIRDVVINVASIRSFVAEAAVDIPTAVQTRLTMSGGGVSGEIRNIGSEPLEDALLVYGSSFQQLGKLNPGASKQIDTVSAQSGFPWGIGIPITDNIDRQQLLIDIYRSFDINQMPLGSGAYLLAWRKQPVVPLHVNGNEVAQDGLTLYIVRLNV